MKENINFLEDIIEADNLLITEVELMKEEEKDEKEKKETKKYNASEAIRLREGLSANIINTTKRQDFLKWRMLQKRRITREYFDKFYDKSHIFNNDIINKIELGFAKGLNNKEICAFAEISERQLNKFLNNTHTKKRLETMKNLPNIKAHLNMVESINKGDIESSKWWLERKKKEEFGKTNIDNNISVNIEISPERQRLIQEAMEMDINDNLPLN